MAEIPVLRTDGRNWSAWRENLERTLDELGVSAYISETTPNPYDEQVNTLAKCAIASTIPDSLFYRILHLKSAQECFETLKNLFEKPTTTTAVQYELRSDKYKREAAYRLKTVNDVRDTSHRDGEVSSGSVRRNDHAPRSKSRRQRQREPKRQGRVERGCGEGEEEGKSKGRKDEKAAAATGPGKGATDQKASGVSLIKPTSSQDSPRARVNTPPSPPPSLTTPSLPVKQTALTSRRPTQQRSQNGHIPKNGTHRTRKDNEWSRRGVESRSRGGREPGDEDGDDVRVHHAHVEPHPPSSTRQTASNEAADTSNPSAMSARPRLPAGTSNGPPNGSSEVEGKGEKGEGNERASGIVDPSSNGENAVPDSIPPTPNPDERGPPPSMPLEGEKGQQSSGHVDETGTHLKPPGHETRTTTHLIRTPYDEESSGECRQTAMGHRESEGEEIEVGVREDDTDTSNRVDERRCRRGEAGDEAGGDKEGQETRGNEGERSRTRECERVASTVEERRQHTTKDDDDSPSPPPLPKHPTPPPPPSPNYPERLRRDDDVDTAKSNKTAARRRADAVHDPGGETDAPGSQPPSVRLEGEKDKALSLYVEANHDEADDHDVGTVDHDTQQSPRRPVGTQDGDTRPPSEPTEPPDEKERERGVDGEFRGTSTVEEVETVEGVEPNASRRIDEPGDEGNEELRSREVEGELGDQSEGDGCQRDGRTIDTGDATSGTTPDSKQVKAGPLTEDEANQHRNGKPNVTTGVPRPPTSLPYDTPRPTHIANPPRRRGRLKTLIYESQSSPSVRIYAPSQTVTLTTTQSN
ncbi:hypothetical protein PAXINDRAFT_13642 [Paxillus involutus ATCC 200175]|uniref:Uncharacterized protein n=1 Tax=Paxillus involutus ATCC 200175 TaxID=664439 RepID=A0A0C9TD69_PAXIN|nr:hypothetical protein PAXINDRAFT_13642 [Paxillus involutus ATCC 200175]